MNNDFFNLLNKKILEDKHHIDDMPKKSKPIKIKDTREETFLRMCVDNSLTAVFYTIAFFHKISLFFGIRVLAIRLEEQLLDFYERYFHNQYEEGIFLYKYFPFLEKRRSSYIKSMMQPPIGLTANVKRIGSIDSEATLLYMPKRYEEYKKEHFAGLETFETPNQQAEDFKEKRSKK